MKKVTDYHTFDYLVDQILKTVSHILNEATYYDEPFLSLDVDIHWINGNEPRITFSYTKGDCYDLHRTPEEYEEEDEDADKKD